MQSWRPSLFIQEKNAPIPILSKAGWIRELVCTLCTTENFLVATGIRNTILGGPARQSHCTYWATLVLTRYWDSSKQFVSFDSLSIWTSLLFCVDGQGWLSRYKNSLRAGRSVDRMPVRVRFSVPVQTGPGALLASYAMGTGSLSPGVKRPGCFVEPPPPFPTLAQKSNKKWSYSSIPAEGE